MTPHRYDDVILREAVVNEIRFGYIEREAAREDTSPELPPILLLHALLATADTLKELISELPKNRRIVAIDLLSAQPLDKTRKLDVRQGNLTRLIHDFMQSVGLSEAVIIGHSHGGVLALRLAATTSLALNGLVLMCPAHPFGGYRSRVVNFYLRQPGRMLALSIPLAPNWMILRAYNEAAGSKSRIHMRHLRKQLNVLRNRNTLRRILEMLRTWDEDMDQLRRALTLKRIAIPTLLIWGDEDPVVPIASADKLEEHLADNERVTLAGMGHLLAEEAPQECASSISRWLERRNTDASAARSSVENS
ncbi:alpha/beta fold hydrolase [Granulicella cerasi]|uniref:Alpha/beta fold hydrolase n=1 Tax=Granulicella cerasi TaxID=741063 RepID=A0ABW1Z9J9_9BACT|nr:alpha/beta hydrolase [Granulicella cerasi]